MRLGWARLIPQPPTLMCVFGEKAGSLTLLAAVATCVSQLLWEYSPNFAPPEPAKGEEEDTAVAKALEVEWKTRSGVLPTSNAEWRRNRQGAREALEKELIESPGRGGGGKEKGSLMGDDDSSGVPALSPADEAALQESFWKEVRAPEPEAAKGDRYVNPYAKFFAPLSDDAIARLSMVRRPPRSNVLSHRQVLS